MIPKRQFTACRTLFDTGMTGAALAWKVKVSQAMPMTMTFAVELSGDALAGTFKPGMFPAGKLAGRRVAATVAA